MILVDTSVWVEVLRDRRKGDLFRDAIEDADFALSRFTEMELLQGARDQGEWALLTKYLETQTYLEMSERSWSLAARLYFDLRRRAITVRSSIDCCIAQVAIEHEVRLVHRDRDFQRIAEIAPLNESWIRWR